MARSSRGWSSRRRPIGCDSSTSARKRDGPLSSSRPALLAGDRANRTAADRGPTQGAGNRLKALDPTGKVEDQRVKSLELKPGQLEIGGRKRECFSYTSDHFELISNARADIVRRAAVRLEQIYAAYTHFLPPRRRPTRKRPMPSFHRSTTAIILIQSQAGYQTWLRNKGRNILNPAFYDAASNEVVCASELQQLGEKLEQTRKEHERQLERIQRQEHEADPVAGRGGPRPGLPPTGSAHARKLLKSTPATRPSSRTQPSSYSARCITRRSTPTSPISSIRIRK